MPLSARRNRGRRRRGRHPYPGIGDRHPIALQVVAAAGVADFPLDGWGHGDLRLVGRRRCVDWVRVDRVRRVWIGIVRVREGGADEDPTDKGGAETTAEATEAAVMEPAVMESAMEPAVKATAGMLVRFWLGASRSVRTGSC